MDDLSSLNYASHSSLLDILVNDPLLEPLPRDLADSCSSQRTDCPEPLRADIVDMLSMFTYGCAPR